ncbi:Cysteine proteinase inhibitor [Morella rubra]|uniref:Cysteine proteinase inhibitor n=1 Tax=Morella rubra TaxID=262757 RepID=A0A6A1WQR6_9ROSI|nr:Cysteine proteinase inhibitor [Morella rubra]
MDMVKPEEKQMGAEGSGSKDKQMADDEFYNDGLHEMTDEEYLFFRSHRLKSDGFDVPAMPDVFSCGMIQPYDIKGEMERIEIGRFAQLAIDEYNRRFEKKKGKLEFVKVLKAMCGVVAGVIFYITFDAKDLADGGMIKTYQSEVFRG